MRRILVLTSIVAIGCMGFGEQALAAQKKKGAKRSYPYGYGHQGGTATQPSSSPFSNPIRQGVPPAVSTTPGRNDGLMRAAPGATRR